GYASGDAAPRDTHERRFTFDRNHNVGLILFSEVLRWKTARALRNIAAHPDPTEPASSEPLPSDGGVFGAAYANPTFVVRPGRRLDLKVGGLVAESSGEFVDPSSTLNGGKRTNYDGGSSLNRDLGLELDGGFEYRLELDPAMALELGAEGGVLFPGNAFADAQ